jgi:mannose-binding lectin 1
LAKLAAAGDLIENLSFGHHGINREMPGWRPTAINHELQYYSDRIILTPPYPGGTRASLWSDNKSSTTAWTAEFQFRVNGQESGGGNLQLWYTKEKEIIGTNSAFTVGHFDGLVLVIDQYGGQGGSIRGFLNDGEHSFKSEHQLESLAFGHCTYHYRNLGRPSKLKVSNHNGLTVTVDDQICFSTPEIQMPSGYYFGVTATTTDTPDSFEVFKLGVSTGGDTPPPQEHHHQQNQQNQQGKYHVGDHHTGGHHSEDHHASESAPHHLDEFPGSPEVLPDVDADTITKEGEQFADLHNRLQGMTHLVANMYVDLRALREGQKEHHEAQMEHMQNIQGSRETGLPVETVNTINRLSERLANIERMMETAQRDRENARNAVARLQSAVDQMHGGISEHLPEKIGHCKSSPF